MQTLVLTDIATGWTECAPLLVREQQLLTEVLSEMRKLLPFALLGLDTDNDSVFMNETVRDYCLAAGVEFTRCRPYRKNDQAWVEQKNGSVVRRTVGYRRFEGLEAATVLARLYAALRLFVNFFQPSFKLAAKARDGAKVTKRYHPPATPCQRLLADARTSEDVRLRLEVLRATLDPVRLLQQIRAAQQELVRLADSHGSRRCDPADRADAGAIPLRAAHSVAGRRGSPDQRAEAEGKALAAPARSVRGGHDQAAGMVRGGTVAHIARTVRAAADRVSRHVSGRAAANMPAPSQGMAPRGRSSAGIWDRAGRRCQRGQQ